MCTKSKTHQSRMSELDKIINQVNLRQLNNKSFLDTDYFLQKALLIFGLRKKVKVQSAIKYPEHISTFTFLKYITQEIEVMHDDSHRIEIFPKLPENFMLSSQHRLDFQKEILQVDPQQKMVSFMDAFPLVKKTMSENLKAYRKYPKTFQKTDTENRIFYLKLLWILGFINNIILICYLELVGDNSVLNLKIEDNNARYVTQVVSVMIIVISTILLLMWTY